MSASPLRFLRSGPPPPKVVLLPDALFFSRPVPITSGATPAEAAAQVELALEAVSPFPLAQLYHGWFWMPGAQHAFAFASYRRRFTSEQTASWADAELVIPTSAALFGAVVEPATTVLLPSPEGLTAIHWDTAGVPSAVVFRPIDPEAAEEERAKVRDEVLRGMGGSKTVIDLLVGPAPDPARNDEEIVFRSGDFVSRLPTSLAAAMDVRDKGELAERRASHRRDLMLWRVALGCAAALVLLLVGVLALMGGRSWQQSRVAEANRLRPEVQKIEAAQELATSIQDLVTKRFLPIEMLTVALGVDGGRKPAEVLVTRIRCAIQAESGAHVIEMDLQTNNGSRASEFSQKVNDLPECDAALEFLQTAGATSRYRLLITFKPGTLKPDSA